MAKTKRTSRSYDFFKSNNFELKEIKPLTANQTVLFNAFDNNDHLFVSGCPGTGKSFLSIYKSIVAMHDPKSSYKKLIILRSIVASRDAGFLPGTIEEKASVFEAPYESIVNELFGRDDAYKIMKERKVIEFATTSHLRGITFKDCIVIVDELQNMSFQELNTVISRVGRRCRIIFSGDFWQTDLTKKGDASGFLKFMNILKLIPDFAFVEMGIEDIVRSELVKKYIIARIAYEDGLEKR